VRTITEVAFPCWMGGDVDRSEPSVRRVPLLPFLHLRRIVAGRRQVRVVHCLVIRWEDLYRGRVDELGVVAFKYDGIDPIIG